jgi:hypothetical protein
MRVLVSLLLCCFAFLLLCGAANAPSKLAADMAAKYFKAKAAAGGVLTPELGASAEELAMQDVHEVQLALERYAVDREDSAYPQHINQLVLTKYLAAGLYANPFTAKAADALDAQEVPFGWTKRAPGNFSYLQIYNHDGLVVGYCLVAYGADPNGGADVTGDGKPDGVIVTLASSHVPFSDDTKFYSGGRVVPLTGYWDR